MKNRLFEYTDQNKRLFIVCGSGDLEVVKVLLESGADADKACNDGATSLLIASQNGYLKVVEVLIEAGADVNRARDSDV